MLFRKISLNTCSQLLRVPIDQYAAPLASPAAHISAQNFEPHGNAGEERTSYATGKGWVTAKAGRPDINRAGNSRMQQYSSCEKIRTHPPSLTAVLRALAEGRIPWAFWPPGADPSGFEAGKGIWISDGEVQDDDGKTEDEATDKDDKYADESSHDDLEDSEEEGSESEKESEPELSAGVKSAGRFNLLQGGDDIDEGEEESSE